MLLLHHSNLQQKTFSKTSFLQCIVSKFVDMFVDNVSFLEIEPVCIFIHVFHSNFLSYTKDMFDSKRNMFDEYSLRIYMNK